VRVIIVKDRRIISDRRKRSTPLLSRQTLFGGQRRTIRREEDKKTHFFVDNYSLRLFIALLFLLMLSISDAYLTLALVSAHNVTEGNPIMAFLLEYSSITFFSGKILFTSIAVFIFCVFNHFGTTRISLSFAIMIYLGVVFYEISIMRNFFH
jgi:hypothetical protein